MSSTEDCRINLALVGKVNRPELLLYSETTFRWRRIGFGSLTHRFNAFPENPMAVQEFCRKPSILISQTDIELENWFNCLSQSWKSLNFRDLLRDPWWLVLEIRPMWLFCTLSGRESLNKWNYLNNCIYTYTYIIIIDIIDYSEQQNCTIKMFSWYNLHKYPQRLFECSFL